MIEQTYYPFGGENAMLSSLSGNSSFIKDDSQNEGTTTNWLGWLLLIGSLIGIGCLVYWWKTQWKSEQAKEQENS